jgi:hypothetical protein
MWKSTLRKGYMYLNHTSGQTSKESYFLMIFPGQLRSILLIAILQILTYFTADPFFIEQMPIPKLDGKIMTVVLLLEI